MDQSDRRMRLRQHNSVLTALRWPNRPLFPEGNTGWTFMVKAGEHPFAVVVGQTDGPQAVPFEVWALGAEQARGLGAVAKTLSADMRVMDASWLKLKLDVLAKVTDGLDIHLDFGGDAPVRVSSASAALARVVAHRCSQLAITDSSETPLTNALFAKEEPSAGPEGTLSWTVDIDTGGSDRFSVFLKEAELEDGSRRPVAIRLAGAYPAELVGLCALLSIDMRIIDPAWIGMKLRKLLDYSEPGGGFFAKVPGGNTSVLYGSAIAYLAHLILYRYAMLGIPTDESGARAGEGGSNVIPLAA